MDELTNYVLNYYSSLMTATEATAKSCVFWLEHAKVSGSPERQRLIEKRFAGQPPEVRALLAEGEEHCLRRIRERILKGDPEKVFLNYCPRCHGLARTPWAKQCHRCFFSWHDPK